jgi:beta-glucosidase-like glycosyl hydrolase/CubicO group peptidase (beta-lactamase class C family)
MSRLFFLTIILSIFLQGAKAQRALFLESPTPWADSVFQTLTIDQKIGQLFMVAAWSDPNHKSYDNAGIKTLIEKYNIGGLIFMQGSPVRQANLTNQYQSISKVPLLLSMDAEWGLGMRLDSTISFPRQMTLGAASSDQLTYEFGVEMARQLKRIGVQVSFSPVLDINNNPKNPVISNRAFGEDRELVTRRGLMYMKGLQDHNVMAVAKHFPGHGDTDTDSHKDLPVIPHGRARLDSLEFYPYRELIAKGLTGSMIAHLYVPALDTTRNLPSTLSPAIVDGTLRKDLGFEGLIFTDALNMQGVAKYWKAGDMDLQALKAGNDVLLFSMNVPLAIQRIKEAILAGEISEASINEKCLRILRSKEWCGLNNWQPIDTRNLYNDLNSLQAQSLQQRMIESSLTVVKNEAELLPLQIRDYKKVAVVEIGSAGPTEFASTLTNYFPCDVYSMEKSPDYDGAMKWFDQLSKYDLVLACMVGTTNKSSKNFGVTNESARIINGVAEKTNVALCILANPYAIAAMRDLGYVKSLVVAYQDDSKTRKACAELLAGVNGAQGKLPVSPNADYLCLSGCSIEGGGKLRWNIPSAKSSSLVMVQDMSSVKGSPAADYEEDMMSDGEGLLLSLGEKSFSRIDSIALRGIMEGAYPGCRVLVAKDGNVLYDKAFGSLNWNDSEPVSQNTIYDLASITKVAAGTLAAMKLTDKGLLDVNKKLGDYLSIPATNPYASVIIKDMLAHTAGFTAWIPFYTKTLKNGIPDPEIYRPISEPGFTTQVAQELYIRDDYKQKIFNQILETPIGVDKSYKYSDLAFYFVQHLVEEISGVSLEQFVNREFYEPMALATIGYRPTERFNREVIAPTENDRTFRQQHIHGFVHDQGAAMQGGIAGHAGLFSNAQDLAAIMQMLMNGGVYGGKRYLSEQTIDLYNTRHFQGNRRGLGFDKPAFTRNTGSTCPEASSSSFGHTGFTGTMCWADPETGIVYVFLSNRVNPDAENKRIQALDIRTKIQHEAYRVLGYGSN